MTNTKGPLVKMKKRGLGNGDAIGSRGGGSGGSAGASSTDDKIDKIPPPKGKTRSSSSNFLRLYMKYTLILIAFSGFAYFCYLWVTEDDDDISSNDVSRIVIQQDSKTGSKTTESKGKIVDSERLLRKLNKRRRYGESEMVLYDGPLGEKIPYPFPPDTRPQKCAKKVEKYKTDNVTVSIVIPYLREKYEYIEGTIGSILDNTPAKLLKEIIFISDGNTAKEGHHEKIESLSSLIRIIKLNHRHGLIYAKTRGAQESVGDIVMFFEPHCIVGRNWLEPLVHIVGANPNSLVLPTLDYIPQENFRKFGRAMLGRYRFEWNFNLIYTNPFSFIDEETSKPFYAPATSGGIFAMRKERFLELNLFDVGMRQWGGDQIELSFKAWRCHGSILVVPCSRVGHLFRDVAHRPYPVDVPTVVENYAKLARVWLEPPYLKTFYKVKPESVSMARNEDLSVPRDTYKRLKCESMKWYVENVDLELGWEADKVCVPAAKGTPQGCEFDAAPGRSTIDRTIPQDEYKELAKKSIFFKEYVEKIERMR